MPFHTICPVPHCHDIWRQFAKATVRNAASSVLRGLPKKYLPERE
jgi:hypothetical protein